MKSRFVGHRFLKQVNNRVIDLFEARHRVLISSPMSPSQKERQNNPGREQKNAVVEALHFARK